jgi:hypothetical protein
LNPEKVRGDVENQIVPLAIAHRSIHAVPKRDCFLRDRQIGDRALLIRRQIDRHVLIMENGSDD